MWTSLLVSKRIHIQKNFYVFSYIFQSFLLKESSKPALLPTWRMLTSKRTTVATRANLSKDRG